MRAWTAAVVAVVLTLPLTVPMAAQTAPPTGSNKKAIQLHWSELAAAVVLKRVAVGTPEGLRVEGQVIAVEPDALRLQVKKGETRIPRASVTTIDLRQKRIRGRIIGTVAGGALGLAGVVAVVFACWHGCPHEGRADAAIFAVLIGTPVAGYFLGNWADRKNTRITILPDTL